MSILSSSFLCVQCGKKYTDAANLDRHINADHAEISKVFRCSVKGCKSVKRSTQFYNLLTHIVNQCNAEDCKEEKPHQELALSYPDVFQKTEERVEGIDKVRLVFKLFEVKGHKDRTKARNDFKKNFQFEKKNLNETAVVDLQKNEDFHCQASGCVYSNAQLRRVFYHIEYYCNKDKDEADEKAHRDLAGKYQDLFKPVGLSQRHYQLISLKGSERTVRERLKACKKQIAELWKNRAQSSKDSYPDIEQFNEPNPSLVHDHRKMDVEIEGHNLPKKEHQYLLPPPIQEIFLSETEIEDDEIDSMDGEELSKIVPHSPSLVASQNSAPLADPIVNLESNIDFVKSFSSVENNHSEEECHFPPKSQDFAENSLSDRGKRMNEATSSQSKKRRIDKSESEE